MANINKNIIMQAGAAVANATNKAAGLSAATPEPGSIISAIQLVNGGRTIGPDALAHFTESVRNKLLSLLVSMEPIQEYNGYDHPWPGGGGVNKLDPLAVFGGAAAIYEVNADGTVTVKSADSRSWTSIPEFQLPAGTYNISKDNATGLSAVRLSTDGYATDHFFNPVGGYTFTFSEPASIKVKMSYATTYPKTEKPQIVIGQTPPTAWTPYSNICPLSGRTGLNVYVGPTSTIGDASTYSMDWTTPAGTVYAGSADIVSGDIKAAPYYASYNGETLVGPWVSSMDVYDPEGTPTTGAQVVDLGGTMTEYHITGQDIITLVGDNYIWSDSGDVTITE